MAKAAVYVHAFNAGVWDRDILPRIDQEKARLVTEQQTNWLCTVTGKMFVRPGQEYLGQSASNVEAELREFVFGATDAALLEFTNGVLRFWVDDQLITRPSVTSAVVSGDFSSATGWTLASTAGQTTTVSGGYLNLTAAGKGGLALAKQQVTTSSSGIEHALRIEVDRGPVTFRCGSTEGGDEYIAETTLREGLHSLAFTPSGSYWVQFQSALPVLKRVQSIAVEAAGVLTLPTPYSAADHQLIRTAQSADVVFVAVAGKQQRRIERRSDSSWSIVTYQVDDGPFMASRAAPVRLKPSVTVGNGTLTADKPFFSASNVGSLFRLFHTGQKVVNTLAGPGQFTDPIEVTGVNNAEATDAEDQYDDRNWLFGITGTWSGEIKTFRSFDGADFGYAEYRLKDNAATVGTTSNDSGDNTDIDSNAITWYRMGFAEGDYTSGAADVTVTYDGGGGYGICRVVGYTSPTEVDIEILSPFKGTTYTEDWAEGEWSNRRGWPSCVALAEGRLWWAGLDRVWGSISDAYESFDDEFEGDAGPISRSIATGGLNQMQWILALQRIIFGTDGNEISARSSSFDEPLTPTNTMLKAASTVGCAPVGPARIDNKGIFVDRSGRNLFEIALKVEAGDYESVEVSRLASSLFASGIRRLAVQRRPDTRVWVIMEDGSCVCLVYEPDQSVVAFVPVETDGLYESVAVIPGETQDRVYFSVARTVGGSTVRMIEKMALDSEARPGTLCRVMDAFRVATPAGAIVSGATHLAGETVVAWAAGAPVTTVDGNGKPVRAEFVVSGAGQFTLPSAPSGNVVYGLPYRARYKSGRLAYAAEMGTAMLRPKKVDGLGLVLTDFARAGLRFGAEFDDADHPLWRMREQVDYETAPAVVTGDVSDEHLHAMGGPWTTDSRVCIETNSPFPASMLGLVVSVETSG